MKTTFLLSKTRQRLLLLLFAAAVLFTSCLKDENHYSVQAAGVALINAAPGSPALDFISDGNRNYLPASFGYDTVLPYWGAYPGFRVFGVTIHGSNDLLGSQQFHLEPGDAYSLFVTDTIGAVKLVLFKDSLDLPDSTVAKIRFANMSANAPALNLVLKGEATKTISQVVYPKATDFEEIEPGNTYSVELVDAGKNKVLATKTNIKIEKGHIYTVWARGIYQHTSDSKKMGISMMENR
ncbi:MAG TPA: DUF4397 domain-containing protein [Arachidicoccus sp.]|nr:DUF4397 domain-containing protein [Arachidicoccus sp.]